MISWDTVVNNVVVVVGSGVVVVGSGVLLSGGVVWQGHEQGLHGHLKIIQKFSLILKFCAFSSGF